MLKRLLKRIKLKDTKVGRVVQALAGVVGLTGTVAVGSGNFSLTGDQLVDIVTIICMTIAAVFGAKIPVAPEDQDKIEN